MATTYGKNYTAGGGSPGSAGTNDTRQDTEYMVESLSGQQTTDNSGAGTNSFPTRGLLDNGKASGGEVSRQYVQIDTSGTSYQTPWVDLKRARPSVF